MKVTADCIMPQPPVPVRAVTIELTEMEAGFLRTILKWNGYTELGTMGGDLFQALEKYKFPEYESKFPDWARRNK